MEGTVIKVSGPLIVAEGMADAKMFDVVRVGKEHLIGEIIDNYYLGKYKMVHTFSQDGTYRKHIRRDTASA